jgi:hypothetical protein
MDPIKSPTLNELESVREMLLHQIEDATLMFSTPPEVRISRAALKAIEELIEDHNFIGNH